ncbi:hypothetical protein FV232_24640 [Methylobacterium sp. WL30]|uniref:ribbon-helix-helix domain-containing protein n=1 Tax=unclassified Methylobacterium TaxID=2615210 RepID=UPI0011CB5E19|nr:MULTISPECIES: ribbon-helix-helix domain-containing protein [unclassified Methylobacterium]TXN40694.1 hypothetical protein FV225_05465 [Methylobacterium sp. WL93]TXN50018.1 hypothetical protein FV227_14150 [Methylobacterium sp. WL119]TXN62819.1 hypothetical protein FV232_24640 [Methylobacterium sp. WL30]
MTKRPSLFGAKSSAAAPEAVAEAAASALPLAALRDAASANRYPKASTREGKRVVTAYVSPEAFRQLKRLAADTDAQQQDLLVEGINLLFEKHGLSRIA